MSKKSKTAGGLTEDFKAMVALVPKLDKLLKMYEEIAAGYMRHRKAGGASIPGIEKHLGVKLAKAANSEGKKEESPKTEKKKAVAPKPAAKDAKPKAKKS